MVYRLLGYEIEVNGRYSAVKFEPNITEDV